MKDAIHISSYDPVWPEQFEAEATRVRRVIGDARIEHYGSTSIPGMPAKPVIDMMIAIETISQGEEYSRLLENDGYGVFTPEGIVVDL